MTHCRGDVLTLVTKNFCSFIFPHQVNIAQENVMPQESVTTNTSDILDTKCVIETDHLEIQVLCSVCSMCSYSLQIKCCRILVVPIWVWDELPCLNSAWSNGLQLSKNFSVRWQAITARQWLTARCSEIMCAFGTNRVKTVRVIYHNRSVWIWLWSYVLPSIIVRSRLPHFQLVANLNYAG